MKRLVIIMLSALLLLPAAMADRKNSLTRRLKLGEKSAPAPTEPFDTVAATAADVRFSGYEKTLRSNRETMFVTNQTRRPIGALFFTITYFDTSGRLLHRASHRPHIAIPAGETRRLDLPSWDKQFTFYYIDSPRPRVAAIPYSVKITTDTILLTR